MDGFSDLLDIHNPQFPDCMIRPVCDKPILYKDELHVSSGLIRLGVVPDLGWVLG